MVSAPRPAVRPFSRPLGHALAVLLAVVGLSPPRAFVWCQTEEGHAAVEELEAGCCGAAGTEARCDPGLASTGPRGPRDGSSAPGEACRDVLVEAPTGLPLGARLLPFPVAALRPFAAETALPPRPAPATSREGGRARAAAHDLILSTILRV